MNPFFWRTLQRKTLVGLGTFSAAIALTMTAQAHPVVFANGTAIMGHHHGKMSRLELVYSPNWYTGLGLETERTQEHYTLLGRTSLLTWRGNFPDLQSNFYLSAAAGKKWFIKKNNQPVHGNQTTSSLAQWSAEWDAEDREYYGRIKYAQLFESDKFRADETLARIGFAPYKAQADEPAIWAMLEWKSETVDAFQTARHEITPLMRFFYKNALFEMGSSLSGKFAFNYMYHFF